MTKKERLDAVLAGKTPDRIPFSFYYHFQGDPEKEKDYVKSHLDFYRESDVDFLKIMCDELLYPFYEPIDCASDWGKLTPLPRDDRFFTESVRRCREITDSVGDECYTFYTFFAPFSLIRNALSITEKARAGRTTDAVIMAHLKEDEGAVLHALQVIAGDLVHLAGRIISEGGCRGIYQSVQGAEKGRMSAEEYARWVEPSDRIVIEGINKLSSCNILHMCSWAGFPNHLEYWQQYPAAVKNWGISIEGLSLSGGLDCFPGCVLMGGLDNRKGKTLHSGTEAEVKENVRSILDEMGDVPFILGADCTMPSDISAERFRWVREALEERR